jgi:hypothetical protein
MTITTDELVERVAQALWEHEHNSNADPEDWKAMARAAIAAMPQSSRVEELE